MSINLINDFSKIYSEQISVASRARNAVADNRLDVEQEKTNASMDKLRKQNRRFDRALASDAARKVERDVKKSSAYGPQRPKPGTVTGRRIEDPKPTGSKPTGYRTESAVPGKPAERLGAVTAIPKSEQEAARERILAKTKAKRETQKPNDGNLANNYPPYDKITRGDVIAGRLGKDEMGGKKKKSKGMKEGFSNWREDLSEVVKDIEDNKQIKEKKNINNKVKTSAMGGGIKLGEAVEEIGGTLLEMVEIDEVDFIVESVYDELLEEGYDEDDIEEAIEYALIEATVTYGHDTDKPYQHKKKTGAGQLVSAVGRLARQKLSSKVRGAKASAKAAVARGARKVAKGALGVARKMEGDDNKANPKSKGAKPTSAPKRPPSAAGTKERVSSGSYQAPSTTKKKPEKPSDPWEGSYKKSSEVETPSKAKDKTKTKKAAAPKAKVPASAPKRQRKSKLDSLLADIRNESVDINEMPYQVMGSPDGGKEKKIGKPVRSKKYADARASELADTHKSTGGKYRSQYVEEIEIDEDAGIVSGLAGLALGAKGASYAAKHSKRMRDYPKNFVKGIVDPRTYVSKKKKEQKEEFQIDEKALSKQQQKFMGMVYAVKKGEMEAPSPEVAKAASGMTTQQAKDFAKTKHKGLPQVKEEMDDSTEISSTSSVDSKKMEQQKKKIQLQKIRDLTTRLTAARKGIY